ncbi:MvdC/MvdD family ATP grasp protein [Microbacterium sp.]|uniref:MvdC/MvdD family ATP grasp protein n=1 Tax=Microbacterium sp. TaxID=51671 RepID=UPI003F72EEF5
MILIESHGGDDHLAPVRSELELRGHEVVVLDSGRYPVETSIAISYDDDDAPELSLTIDGTTHDLTTCRAAWWRRSQPFTLDPRLIDADARSFAYTESSEGLEGLRALLKVSWINDPLRDGRAAHKPYQLREARRAGLVTPRTLMTNDPVKARAFVADHAGERTVYKSFLAVEGAWRETRVLREDEVDRLELVQMAPVIFQEYVEGDVDLRVTVVGDIVQAAAVHSGRTEYATDYRMALDTVVMEPYALPVSVERSVIRLMRRLGLVYGALDFRVRPNGEHVFFEINPSGQWLFIEEKTGLPLTRTFVDALASADRGSPHPRSAPSGCVDCEQNTSRAARAGALVGA